MALLPLPREGSMTMPDGEDALRERLAAIVEADPGLMGLLRAIRPLGLPQWRLVSGALYQTVWNVLTDRPRGTGIKDYDVIYYDASDLSWDAEDVAIRRVARAVAGEVGPVELRNQARVHLWFEARFGLPVPPLGSADEALLRYASTTHAVAVRLEPDGRLDIAAPFGLADVFAMVLRPNHVVDNRATYTLKGERMRAIWPELTILPW
jgi:hypothetical protein